MAARLNSSHLKQAREARKLSKTEVSEFAKISELRLTKFEAGDLEPSYQQLARLGQLYNVPFDALYNENPLFIESNLPDFRKTNPSAADLSPKGLTRLWQVETRTEFVETLVGALGEKAPKTIGIGRLTNKSTPEAAELRAGFDQWLGSRNKIFRFTGTPEDVFLRHLRLFMETRACLTSVNNAPIDDYMGFYQSISGGTSVVFINSEIKHQKRRLFTLAHEMAHFVFDEQGISNPFVANNLIEKRCNNFAATFLAPDKQVLDIVRSTSSAIIKDVSRLATLLARETLLSRQAAALRLQELDVISRKNASDFFRHLNNLRRITEPSPESTGNTPKGRTVVIAKKLSEVGVFAAYTASIALKNKIVDVVDIERGLGISENILHDVLDRGAKRFEASID